MLCHFPTGHHFVQKLHKNFVISSYLISYFAMILAEAVSQRCINHPNIVIFVEVKNKLKIY